MFEKICKEAAMLQADFYSFRVTVIQRHSMTHVKEMCITTAVITVKHAVKMAVLSAQIALRIIKGIGGMPGDGKHRPCR